MEETLVYASISLIIVLVVFKHLLKHSHGRNLPPSPPSLPVIGHLHLLKDPLHRTLQKISESYGGVFSLKFGSQTVVVVSSPAAIQECFTKNDIVLANRRPSLAGKYMAYNQTTIVSAPYGEHWRNLRRIGAIEIFSTSRLNTFSQSRRDEVMCLIKKLSRNSLHDFSKVELQSLLTTLTFNIVMTMVAGKRYYGNEVSDHEEASKFRDLMMKVTAIIQTANPGEFFPVLNWVDLGGYKKRIMEMGKTIDSCMQGIIDEHRSRKEEGRNTMIGHLLSLQQSEPENYSDQIIKGFMLSIILGGTDTASVTIEWAMTNLLNNPQVLNKVKAEIDSQIGERPVDEGDIVKLPLLRGVIWETLRLNPSAPLLVPHFSSDNCTIGSYHIPRGTMLLVNSWALHRDPSLWEEPTRFNPERYENGKGEEVSHKLMPFGLGRRACPGSGLAQRVVGLSLASLIQCFEWKRVGEDEIDMSERKGVSSRKAIPLEAMCQARPIVQKILSD